MVTRRRVLTALQNIDIFEGSVIRCFRRLQELLRQMGQAAHAIGNTELEEKFSRALEMLERPNTVVFNPSYVSLWRIGPQLTYQVVLVILRIEYRMYWTDVCIRTLSRIL